LWLVAGGALVAAAGIAAALSLALRSGDGATGGSTGGSTDGGAAPGQLSHAAYRDLWQNTHIGDAQEALLERWPSPPYQHYKDSLNDDCYEWSDEPAYLYNLCFSNGVLRLKELS